jgi:catechol 2,3-dioxygenase-like lactoylglutathione lyase family enzyme
LRGGVWFCVGNVDVHLGVEAPFNAAKKAHPAFLVPDIDSLAARLKPVIWDRSLPDRHRFFTADPFGNRIEFIQDPKVSSVQKYSGPG